MKYFFLLVYKMQSEQIKSKSNQYLMQLPQNSNSSCRSTGSGQVLFKHLDKTNKNKTKPCMWSQTEPDQTPGCWDKGHTIRSGGLLVLGSLSVLKCFIWSFTLHFVNEFFLVYCWQYSYFTGYLPKTFAQNCMFYLGMRR